MKKLFITAVNFYQVFLSSIIHQITGTKNACRFNPTCSEYAKTSVSEHGVLKGAVLSFIRILKCQPFYGTT